MEDKDITKNIIRILIPERLKNINLPLFLESVSAGFPSPADDYLEGKLDLNDFLIPNPPATFLVHVTGDSMIGAGIYSGDLLIVDRSVEPHNHNIVIAVLDGELTVKRLIMEKDEIKLVAENKNYKPIKITEQMQFEIWGVVRTVIHSLL
ncbi:MAG TPA: translesion error-prone DNA polymerase V autoproteolytic subunit [Candidatus Kapabacteria bacterium]|nr:translesion error-prone DNA polymerase V autoproteolytic subunit [Candidatus Kapabacteria bacterium]HOV91898.1 translesion error-prone DNA polymerase V autoproteolytic subunit [Candidatus Kapabacteria bacterium]